MKAGRPAFTVDQPEEAMEVLREVAGTVGAPLLVASNLGAWKAEGRWIQHRLVHVRALHGAASMRLLSHTHLLPHTRVRVVHWASHVCSQ